MEGWTRVRIACRGTGWAMVTLAMAGWAPASGQSPAPSAAAKCRFETLGTGTVRSVVEARTLVLEDGREVRLAGLDNLSHEVEPEQNRALEARLAGRPVVLKRLGEGRDRYGRLLAHVFLDENGRETWLQEEILAAGTGRVTRVGDPICAAALQAREHAARAAKLGLWGDPSYSMAQAEDVNGISERRGRFAIVEGRVVSVRESGSTIYVNFGRRWSEDFTVTIAKRHERAFAAAGTAPNALTGRLVRIRGWVEERGGPWVDAVRPEQVEPVERRR
jgi:endonuclease YncB( thermonuclease family)